MQTGTRPRFDADGMKAAFGYDEMNRSTFLVIVLMAIARIEKAMDSLASAPTTVAAQAAMSSTLHGVSWPLTAAPSGKLGHIVSADRSLVVVASFAAPDRISRDKVPDLTGSTGYWHTHVVSVKVAKTAPLPNVTVLDGPLWCVLLRHLDAMTVSEEELRPSTMSPATAFLTRRLRRTSPQLTSILTFSLQQITSCMLHIDYSSFNLDKTF
ncbi:hypothetical protein SDRG_10948 [Saprolegnia diclina VS20]|uniref:Uncharacterized protein n=1 Tax=Saprolegnia diclina (strain VS20) TaxID=1156394 RepID=T0Q9M4_SAPDV|nr:hypothetical protein SDRG_10948 [Saprolegnia diclina VS20]EQC31346.1 hypothetical protein SDRG_10948 [Saprolegnia diclina VS20]|eukprot:XP_008615187.1 hypothetical protein SDRG_10948 [Saprolegnia diclina VS20]